ncbi:MAG TPA: glycosyltransferase [Kineosporiaceae bacterium]|nr:glycosyltransferase [Kineosporiaceae bacterium]
MLDLSAPRPGSHPADLPRVAEHNWRGIEPAGRTENMVVDQALATVQEAPFIVDVLRAADDLALAAARNGGHRAAEVLTRAAHDPEDELTAIAAVHALGRVFDDEADAVLSDLLSHQRAFLREQAAWTLGARLPRLDAIGRLIAVVTAGGFSGMLAQRTLIKWARSASDHVALALEGALTTEPAAPVRARLVETLGLVPGQLAGRTVVQIAADPTEPHPVRVAAISALGDRDRQPEAMELIRRWSGASGLDLDPRLQAVARLAAIDLGLIQTASVPASGLTVAQLFLHADIDPELTRSGIGDNGGVATLLLRLGAALAEDPQVSRVLTLSRGTASASLAALADPTRSDLAASEHLLSPVPLLQDPGSAAQAWPTRVAAERAIRRALTAYGPVDVLHLRMADVGSLAADAVARKLNIPVVFTLAPDPHSVIHALDMSGALARSNFGTADEQEHYWFRARLVQRLAANAAHNVLFPRPELDHDLRELLGIERTAEPQRYTVVPEGIDLAVTASAQADVLAAAGGVRTEGLIELDRLISRLPEHRRGLPLAISVGRLHRAKGMATVVEAWAGRPDLRERCNLVIVGGDLSEPSPDEQTQVEQVRAVLAADPTAAHGLVLAGHRPNGIVAQWLAAAHRGLLPQVGPGGIYVCGSLKEEFGLAILEALAAGLVVVAPAGGGPATYVEPGVTGLLVDTQSSGDLAAGLLAALDLAADPRSERRAEAARALVRERFTVQAMARTLAGVYVGVTAPAHR